MIIEGLSLIINQAKSSRKIIGIKVTGIITLTHTLFVDYVLLFGDGSMLEWMHYKSLIDLFYGASGMTINPRKSVFGLQITLQDSLRQVSMLFSYPCKSLEEGLSYLGFHLKPNNNRVGDWNCLIKKSQAKVNRLTPRWILIDGRVTLVTFVLQSIPA